MLLTEEQNHAIVLAQLADKKLSREICWHDVSYGASRRMNEIAVETYVRHTCEHEFPEHPQFGLMECELCGQQPPKDQTDGSSDQS